MTGRAAGRERRKTRRRLTERRAAERWGRLAEALAAGWLWLKGYRIVARRFRSPQGEIDLIASKARTLVLIEVKARDGEAAAGDALRLRQQRRIERAALAFLQHHPAFSGHGLRFDLVLVVPGRRPRHIIDAWRPVSGGSI